MSAVGACTSAESRGEPRNGLRARCEVNGSGRDCRILNLTPRDAFVESFVPAVTGSRVTLRFNLPNGHHVCTTGVVRNHEFKVGFGVDLTGISERDVDQIGNFLA
jgi:hypothetical protein